MTPLERTNEILLEERRQTMVEIASLETTEEVKRGVIAALVSLQEAVNKHLAAQVTAIDARIMPAALAGLSTEMSRVYKRLADEGLIPGSPQQN